MSNEKFRELKRAYRLKVEAEGDFYEEVKKAFIPGEKVHYWHGNNLVPVFVEKTSMGRVKVTSNSGATYWIDSFRFEEFKSA